MNNKFLTKEQLFRISSYPLLLKINKDGTFYCSIFMRYAINQTFTIIDNKSLYFLILLNNKYNLN